MVGIFKMAALVAMLSVAGQAAGQALAESRAAQLRAISIEACEYRSSAARKAMEHRQSGTAMSVLMARITKAADGDQEMIESATPMIIAAYEEPRYGTEKQQQRTIRDFENDQYLACMKSTQARP